MKEIGLFIIVVLMLVMTSCTPCDDGEADEFPTDNGNTIKREVMHPGIASKSNAA